MKRCNRCGEQRHLGEFSTNPKKYDGLSTFCKPCNRIRMRELRSKDPAIGRRARSKYDTIAGRASALLAASRARRGGNLTREWVEERLATGLCEVTGLGFDLSPQRERRGQNPLAPSLDRIDPSGGYTTDNVRVVIFAFNAFKGRMSQDEAVSLIKRMAENL